MKKQEKRRKTKTWWRLVQGLSDPLLPIKKKKQLKIKRHLERLRKPKKRKKRKGQKSILQQPKVMTKHDALRQIWNALESAGFASEVYGDYVFARLDRTRGTSYGLFILLQRKESPDVQKYSKAKITLVFHVSMFRERLRKLKQWLFRMKPSRHKHIPMHDVEGLDMDVLTSFGWHAYIGDSVIRRNHLVAAASELGETRVIHILAWLKNSWERNPIMPQKYVSRVKDDYDWFYTNFGEHAYQYYHLKREVHFTLREECKRLLEKKKTSLFRHVGEVDRFLLVTY